MVLAVRGCCGDCMAMRGGDGGLRMTERRTLNVEYPICHCDGSTHCGGSGHGPERRRLRRGEVARSSSSDLPKITLNVTTHTPVVLVEWSQWCAWLAANDFSVAQIAARSDHSEMLYYATLASHNLSYLQMTLLGPPGLSMTQCHFAGTLHGEIRRP